MTRTDDGDRTPETAGVRMEDEHDRAADDVARATNTAYSDLRRQRDELLTALRAINALESKDGGEAWAIARAAIAKAEGR